MQKYIKYFLIVITVLLIIIIAWLFYLNFKEKKNTLINHDQSISEENKEPNLKEEEREVDPTIVYDNNVDNNQDNVNNARTEQLIDLDDEEMEKLKLERMARNFIDVFASYSTDSHYQNLQELKDFIYDSYWQELSKKISNNSNNDIKYSVWTESLNANLIKLEANKAVVELNTKRVERKSLADDEKIFYQKVKVYYILSSSRWLVTDVIWEN